MHARERQLPSLCQRGTGLLLLQRTSLPQFTFNCWRQISAQKSSLPSVKRHLVPLKAGHAATESTAQGRQRHPGVGATAGTQNPKAEEGLCRGARGWGAGSNGVLGTSFPQLLYSPSEHRGESPSGERPWLQSKALMTSNCLLAKEGGHSPRHRRTAAARRCRWGSALSS